MRDVPTLAASSRIDKTNIFFGFQLIETDASNRRTSQLMYRFTSETEIVFGPEAKRGDGEKANQQGA